MNTERFKELLKSLKWKPKYLTTKSEDGHMFIFLSRKRYEVSETGDKMILTTREGRSQQADRLFYQNRKLT